MQLPSFQLQNMSGECWVFLYKNRCFEYACTFFLLWDMWWAEIHSLHPTAMAKRWTGQGLSSARKALMKYLLSLRCTHLVDLLYWKSRSSFCQPNCHDSFALLFFPSHLQITITQFGILETLKPTEFQREQTSSCFLFLSGWTIGLLLCKPWHTRTFPKQTIICLFCWAFLI